MSIHRYIVICSLVLLLASILFFDYIIADRLYVDTNIRLLSLNISNIISRIEFYILISLTALTLSLILRKIKKNNHKDLIAYTTFISLSSFVGFILTSLVVLTLKFIVGRPRPFVYLDVFEAYIHPFSLDWQFQSMPSGNAAAMGALTVVLTYIFPKYKWYFLPTTFVVALLRIVSQAHYLSDVLVGFAIGMVVMTIAFSAVTSTSLGRSDKKLSKTDVMRIIDKYIGIPVCFVLTITRKLWRFCFPRKVTLNKKPQNILFINFAELGAIVLTNSAIERARRQFPNAKIFFMSFPQAIPTLEMMGFNKDSMIIVNPDSILSFIGSSIQALIETRKKKIDTTLNTEVFIRFSTIMAYLSGAKRRVGFHPINIRGMYVGDLVTDKLIFSTQTHACEAYQSLVMAINREDSIDNWLKENVPTDERKLLKIDCKNSDKTLIKNKLQSLSSVKFSPKARFVLLNPNASDLVPIRKWPHENYKTIALKFLKEYPSVFIVITGSKSEVSASKALVKEIGQERVISFAGETSFSELISLYSISSLLITNDSGPAHFASTTSIPTIVLFGPETPTLFGPVGENQEVVSLSLACSPCISPFNAKTSPCNDPVCIKNITSMQVFERAKKILSQNK